MNPDLEKNAQILTNAIRTNEGGDKYDVPGDGGKSWGAYQFGQGAWQRAASLAGIKSAWGKASPAEQNQAADAQVRSWLSQGKSPAQIASMWNAGEGEPDAYSGKFSNGAPSTIPGKFDVQGYTKKVLNSASSFWQAQKADEGLGQSALKAPGQIAGAIGGALGQAGKEIGPVGIPAGIGAGAGIGALAMAAAPEVGAAGIGEGLVGGAEDLLGKAGGAVKGVLSSVFGGSKQNPTEIVPVQQSPSETALAAEQQQPQPKSATYNALQSMLGSMVGGQQISQEAQRRGVDPIAEMEQTGAIPQPDENGNLDKEAPMELLKNLVKQDKTEQKNMASTLTLPTFLPDLEKAAIAQAEAKMQGSPHLESTKDKIRKTFENYRAQQPKRTDRNGRQYVAQHVTPNTLQLMKDRATEGENWATPHHERSASQHIYESMRTRLSEIAKHQNVKGWDETNKRMEARLLAMKAIKKLPKKAERDKFKEFKKDLAASLAGGLVARSVGHNSLVGATIGHLIETQLSKREYKKLGTDFERKQAEKRSKTPQKGLLSRELPGKKDTKGHKA